MQAVKWKTIKETNKRYGNFGGVRYYQCCIKYNNQRDIVNIKLYPSTSLHNILGEYTVYIDEYNGKTIINNSIKFNIDGFYSIESAKEIVEREWRQKIIETLTWYKDDISQKVEKEIENLNYELDKL